MNARCASESYQSAGPHRLLSEWRQQGVSIREIGRRLRLAPKTVLRLLADLPEPNDPPPGYDPAQLRRCRSCGALVYLWPCLACSLNEPSLPTSPGVTCHVHS